METNKNNINECLEEFDKEMKTNFGSLKHQVCNRDMKIEDIIEFSKNFLKQKLQQVEQRKVEEIRGEIENRIEQCNLLLEELEKGNDLNGGDIKEQIDHEISAKVVLESLLKSLKTKE